MNPTTTQGFRGYQQRDIPTEDAELTHVGPGTPCGEYLRRYWQPVAMASELDDLPLAVRILGEDLVLFRDRSGRTGLLHRHCSHRGASLEYGIVMECGIKCCYHGWHYDIDGTILDLPSEPAGSPIRHKVVQGAYPTREHDGIIFAYLGPPAKQPDFPIYDTMRMADTEAIPFSLSIPCNWLQVYENTQDPIHVIHLHARSSGVQFGVASGIDQVIDYRDTPLGMINIQTRRCGDYLWTRTTESILPNGNQTGAIWEEAESQKIFQRASILRWMVPVDDTHTVTIGWRYHNARLDPRGQDDPSRIGKETIDFVGQTPDRPYQERQRYPGDYEVQVSQRPIARHALEHLATSDRGVARLRRLLRHHIRALAAGEPVRYPDTVDDRPVSTYCQDTVFPVAQPDGDEKEFMAHFGRRVGDVLLEHDGQPAEKRIDLIRDMCEKEFAG
jgi:phenylpropionate dioxygenase-like ring-hydroxylating dioxygenase large terminal subunit